MWFLDDKYQLFSHTSLADNSELNNVQWRVVIIDEAHRLKNKNCKLLEGLKMLNMVSVYSFYNFACTALHVV